MYPVATSFIPVTVALARFAAENSWFTIYPYWYLGSTPFNYLTGPIVPTLLVALAKILPNFSLFDLSYFILITSHFALSLGWGVFGWSLSKKKTIGILIFLISLVLPWKLVSSLALSDVSAVLASALTPWVLAAFAVILNFKFKILNLLLPAVAFALLLLTNTVASIPAMVGLLVLGVTAFQKWEEGLKKVVIVVLVGWVLTLWWYEPNFWLTIFKAPSFGGKSAVSVFLWLFNLLRGLVPVILAVAVVWWGFSKKDKFLRFSISWFAIFLILTILRFLSNPDFWLDWTSWMGEVEIGLVLLVAKNFKFQISNFQSNRNFKLKIAKTSIFYLLFTSYFIVGWFFAWQKRDFWLPRKSIEETAEYRIASFLNENVKSDETVFLSGTTAFWLNSFYDIKQVRGGADQASLHSTWRDAAWELRQGASTQKAEIWLKKLGIDYIVVHTNKSSEFYHDFKNTEKFERSSILRKFYDQRGDLIYRVDDN